MTKSNARIQLDRTRAWILKLFNERCLMCGAPSTEIHEILPISFGKRALSGNNRVILCRKHHDWAHNSTKVSIPILKEKRKEFLERTWKIKKL